MVKDEGSAEAKVTPELAQAVSRRTARKLRARANTSNAWFGLGMMGLVGWSVVVPTVGGAALGVWLDRHRPGASSWTLALLTGGLVLGCTNAWYWVTKEDRAMARNRGESDE